MAFGRGHREIQQGKTKISCALRGYQHIHFEDYKEEYELDVLTIVGSAGGILWSGNKNIIPPDSESDSEDDEEDAHRAQLTWWECKGALICMERNFILRRLRC